MLGATNPVPLRIMVKRLLTILLLLAALPALSAPPEPKGKPANDDTTFNEPPAPPQNPKAEKIVNASLLVCGEEMTVKHLGMQHKLPANIVGTLVRTDSKRTSCQGQFVSIVSQGGDHYFGMTWFLDEQEKLPTIE